MYINKNNVVLSLIFTFIACVLISDLFNNLDKIVQLKLNEMLVLLMLFIASNSSIAIYFGSIICKEDSNESVTSRIL